MPPWHNVNSETRNAIKNWSFMHPEMNIFDDFYRWRGVLLLLVELVFVFIRKIFLSLSRASLAFGRLHWHGVPACPNILPPCFTHSTIVNTTLNQYILYSMSPGVIISRIYSNSDDISYWVFHNSNQQAQLWNSECECNMAPKSWSILIPLSRLKISNLFSSEMDNSHPWKGFAHWRPSDFMDFLIWALKLFFSSWFLSKYVL